MTDILISFLYKLTLLPLGAKLPREDILVETIQKIALYNVATRVESREDFCWVTKHDDRKISIISRNEPKEYLGSGTYAKKVYAGTIFFLQEDSPVKMCHAAIIKVAISSFSLAPYELLNKVPRSPFLGGRPVQCLFTDKYTFIVQKRLSEPPLSNQLKTEESPHLFIQGMRAMACGLSVLHSHGIVHRDPKSNNSTSKELFDYNTICSVEGVHPLKGAPIPSLPPEVIFSLKELPGLNPSIREKIEKRHKELSMWDEEASVLLERKKTISIIDGNPAFSFDPSFDVFVFGMEFVYAYGHPMTWDESHPLFNIKKLILSTLHFDQEKRPSMITVEEGLNLFINSK